jgi:hypothetical protein
MKPITANAAGEISEHLDAIKSLFKPGAKVTLLVRTPSHRDGSRDLLMTDDIIDEAIGAMLRRKHEGPDFTPTALPQTPNPAVPISDAPASN